MRCLGYFIKKEIREDMGEKDLNYQFYLIYPQMKGDLLSFIKGKNKIKFTENQVIIFLI
jgi:hypothetical protein